MKWPWKYYESEITVFFRQLMQEKPHIREEQKKGRSLWWDKKLDPEQVRRNALSRVPRDPYAYQPETKHD